MARNLDPAQLLVGARLSKYSSNALTVTGSVNAHAEELRRYFVAHDGQVELCVAVNPGGVDYTSIRRQHQVRRFNRVPSVSTDRRCGGGRRCIGGNECPSVHSAASRRAVDFVSIL